jgi:protein required for attachment to host cells
MQVPNNAFVLVADGRKMLWLRNDGDEAFPNLVVEMAEEHPNPRDIDQKTDQAGRASSTRAGSGAPAGAGGGANQQGSAGGSGAQFAQGGGTMGEADYHQLEEDRFAAECAEMLRKRALARKYDKLVVIAPAKTLGELRKHYHKEVESRLIGELAKDLTGHPIPDIEAAIKNA